MTVRKSQGYRYLPLCLLLVSACAFAEVREVRLHGPNGDGGSECTDTDPAEAAPAPAAKPAAAKPAGAARIKPVVTVRGGGSDEGSAHAPRWHSFLPGMFR